MFRAVLILVSSSAAFGCGGAAPLMERRAPRFGPRFRRWRWTAICLLAAALSVCQNSPAQPETWSASGVHAVSMAISRPLIADEVERTNGPGAEAVAADEKDDLDSWICEDPGAGGSDCAETMRQLYCRHLIPIIYQGLWYSQTAATDLCLAEQAPFHPDIGLCLQPYQAFVSCMVERGWKPEATEVFDVKLWQPQGDESMAWLNWSIQALGFFAYSQWVDYGGFGGQRIVEGGVRYRFPKSIQVESFEDAGSPWSWGVFYLRGHSHEFNDNQISVPMIGYAWGGDVYGHYYEGYTIGRLFFTPVDL